MNKNIIDSIRYALIFVTMTLLSVNESFSQPEGMPINHVREGVYVTASAVNVGYNSETYFDGLGRELQKVHRYPHMRDQIEMKGYDSYGRLNKNYLVFPTTNTTGYNFAAASEQRNYYLSKYGSSYGYSQYVYDNTVSGNVIEESRPGTSWRIGGGHTTRTKVTKNIAGDNIRKYSIVNDTTVVFSGTFYAPGKLIRKVMTDPDDDRVYEYYDINENLIVKQQRIGDTYYLYDDFGLLKYIIPPMADEMFDAATSKNLQELKKYCYYTEYDERHRPYKSYVPGGGCTINLYDKKDRLVLSQNEGMRGQGKWFFTKYDLLDRPVITGVCGGTEAQHKAGLEAQTIFGETGASFAHRYSNLSYPTAVNGNDYLTVTYYDNYDWQGEVEGGTTVSAWPDQEFPHTVNNKVAGLITGTMQKILGVAENKWLLSANYYDSKYREIQTVRQLYPEGLEIVYRAYDFVGKLTRVREKQTIGGKMEGFDRYLSYDTPGRLSEVKQKMLGYVSTELVSIARYKYTDLSQIAEKAIHNGIDTTKYLYGIDGFRIGSASPLFSFKLYYDTKPENMNYPITPRYDGNISFLEWSSDHSGVGVDVTKGYRYVYDGVKQLKEAKYLLNTPSGWTLERGYDERDITYDLNGNITKLNRSDKWGNRLHAIDNEYNGNQLSDSNINGVWYDYRYDANGNMTYDGNKGINISYNVLDLPEKIVAGTEKVSYIYSASGSKLAIKVDSLYTYYRGSFIYNGDELDHILQPEGIIRKTTGAYVYYYAKQDHLGSTRVLCHEANGQMKADQITDYYPFGLLHHSNGTNVNRYLFSGKELQDHQTEDGKSLELYDFGARNYDPVLGRWFNIDPHASKYYSTSPYAYVLNTPVNAIDPDGKRVLFVNGFHFGDGGTSGYWNGIDKSIMQHLGDTNATYYDGSLGGVFGLWGYNGLPHLDLGRKNSNLSANVRYDAGYKQGQKDVASILVGLSEGETIKVITHSMGAAYAKGLVQAFLDWGIDPSRIAFEADFAPYQPRDQKAVKGVNTFEITNARDGIATNPKLNSSPGHVEGSCVFIKGYKGHDIDDFWDQIETLPSGKYKVENGQIIKQ